MRLLPTLLALPLCLAIFFSAAQTGQSDELKTIEQKIAAAKEDTTKVNLLLDASDMVEYGDSAKAFRYIEQAFALAEKLKEHQLVATVINVKAIVYDSHEDYPKAIATYHIELAYMHKHNVLKKLGPVYNNVGNSFLNWEKFDSTLFYYQKALAENLKTKAIKPTAIAYGSLGNYYQTIGDFETAAEHQLLALKYKEQLKDIESIAHTQSSLIVLFKDLKQYDDALYYGKLAEANYEKAANPRSLVIVNVNIGLVYSRMKKYDSAIARYQKAIYYTTKASFLNGKQTAYNNMALAYRLNGEPAKALAALDSAWATTNRGGSYYVKFAFSSEYVNTYVGNKEAAKATPWVDSAAKYVVLADAMSSRRDYNQMLAEYYEATNNYALAYKHQRIYEELKDSMLNEGNVKTLQLLKTKYETEKKEKQIKEQELTITKRNYIIAGIAALVLLVGLLAWSYIKRYRLKQQKELQEKLHLQQQKATIDILTAEEKERKRIASDLHDGVGQLMTAAWLNLQAVNTQTEKENTEQSQLINKTLHLVDESCKEVRAVSHNMMPNALLKKGLVNAVREFIQQINAKNTQINLQADGLGIALPSHVETVLYRVIQESVNNVIKHAAASSLDISINQDKEGIDVMIEDNGKGFNIAEAEKKDGIGLQNIKSRIQYLKGTVEWNSSANKGTLVAIHIPANVS